MAAHRTHNASVRFTPEEWQQIKARAVECGITPSRYLRELGLGSRPRARPGAINRQAVYHLARIGNNLNQIARLGNSFVPVPASQVREVLEELRATQERLWSGE